MDAQRTLKRSITCAGIGLHSGRKVTLSLKPAPAGSGIRFRRTDLGGVEIPATIENLGTVAYATQLRSGDARVETVEHVIRKSVLMDNCRVIAPLLALSEAMSVPGDRHLFARLPPLEVEDAELAYRRLTASMMAVRVSAGDICANSIAATSSAISSSLMASRIHRE